MNGRKTFLYGLIAGFAVLGGGSAAQACFYTTPLCTGSRSECHPTPRQRLVQERRWAEEGVRRLTAEGQRRLLAGEVDVAAELAEWLVPNVRPVFVVETSCGLMGEPDPGAGRETWRTLFLDVVAGSPLAEADPDDIGYLARIDEEFSFGAPCNAEFRTRFAAFLREQIEAKTLAEAWLFLGARRQSDFPRLVSFERSERTPPVRWAIAVYSVIALIAIGFNGWDGWRRHRYGTEPPPHDDDTPEDRHRFLGYATALLAGLSAIAVIYAALVVVFVGTCR